MQTTFTARPACRSACRRSRKRSCANACIAASAPRPARPMCCSATSSIQPARPHLPDQGHAGERPAGRQRDRQAIDRCLSCLACMTTCPSGVNYMHLVDHARAHIEKTYRRPLLDRLLRALLAFVLPYPARFRAACGWRCSAGRCAGAFRPAGSTVAAMLRLAPMPLPAQSPDGGAGVYPAEAATRGRVAILAGCGQPVLDPGINEAAIRLLTRLGVEVVVPEGEGCCGALVHHMGREEAALASARGNIDAWMREIDGTGSTRSSSPHPAAARRSRTMASCCASIRPMPRRRPRSRRWPRTSAEYLAALDLPRAAARTGPRRRLPFGLLDAARPEDHAPAERIAFQERLRRQGDRRGICAAARPAPTTSCSPAGDRLRDRKVANIESHGPDVVATGNIGCITQIASAPACRWCTRSNCSTGRPAAPLRKGCVTSSTPRRHGWR